MIGASSNSTTLTLERVLQLSSSFPFLSSSLRHPFFSPSLSPFSTPSFIIYPSSHLDTTPPRGINNTSLLNSSSSPRPSILSFFPFFFVLDHLPSFLVLLPRVYSKRDHLKTESKNRDYTSPFPPTPHSCKNLTSIRRLEQRQRKHRQQGTDIRTGQGAISGHCHLWTLDTPKIRSYT